MWKQQWAVFGRGIEVLVWQLLRASPKRNRGVQYSHFIYKHGLWCCFQVRIVSLEIILSFLSFLFTALLFKRMI